MPEKKNNKRKKNKQNWRLYARQDARLIFVPHLELLSSGQLEIQKVLV